MITDQTSHRSTRSSLLLKIPLQSPGGRQDLVTGLTIPIFQYNTYQYKKMVKTYEVGTTNNKYAWLTDAKI